MNEEEAIEILLKVKEYYSLKRTEYDNVIKWLEGRIKRRKKKQKAGFRLKKKDWRQREELLFTLYRIAFWM